MPKGWERLSIRANTRPDKLERNISRHDLLIPYASWERADEAEWLERW
jgi:hypothetical protein